jgi:hypothetical protein
VNQLLAGDPAPGRDVLAAAEEFFMTHANGVLGLTVADDTSAPSDASAEAALVKLLIAVRKELRTQKLWALSDHIRDGLAAAGIVLEDTREGTTWKKGTAPAESEEGRAVAPDVSPAARTGGIPPELPKNVRTVFGDDDF